MEIYAIQTEAMTEPIGIDCPKPAFSWKLRSDEIGACQQKYRIVVSDGKDDVWDSGWVESDETVNVRYGGAALKPSARYYWYVTVYWQGKEYKSKTAWFETGLMGTDSSVWRGACWIGSPDLSENTDGIRNYAISAEFLAESGRAGIAFAARDKDNYLLADIDMNARRVIVYDYRDNAWTDGIPSVDVRGEWSISEAALPIGSERESHKLRMEISGGTLSLYLNDTAVIDREEDIIPEDAVHQPRKRCMLKIGLKQEDSRTVYTYLRIENTDSGMVYQEDDFRDDSGALSALGEAEGGKLLVENRFELISPSPSVNLRRCFSAEKPVKSARLYAASMGFYEAYINGKKVNSSFYEPGFTDYRKRIEYRVYDVTEFITTGENTVGAIVSKGYYSGYLGYNAKPMVYGNQNYFIGMLLLEYSDGTKDVIVTDKTWQFTDKGPVISGDYIQGEDYDGRLEFDWSDKEDKRWRSCGSTPWPEFAEATNGKVEGVRFELSAPKAPAVLERVIQPVSEPMEAVKGHFVYDVGQNVVGTLRLFIKGERGLSVKLRYGEMCYKNGRLYTANLRNAANTDTYTLKGDPNGEEFTASFASHGFRYVEISGNGFELTRERLDRLCVRPEAVVITNTPEVTGEFSCSNEDINRLQENIQWGQRGNSLLVFTDCPQRNERMGWTGDAQVFAKTAAYNMDVRAFMNKWLMDLRDAQLLYNMSGAVPDTAPLGGDNRKTGGCGGWGDAAVIVPWEMYLSYGDISILERNYPMMRMWVDYLCSEENRNCGERIVDGALAEYDHSPTGYIQRQQSRGDHLAYDRSTPFILSATAYAARSAEITADTARILGKSDDEKKYRCLWEKICRSFREAWVKEDGSLGYWGEQSFSEPDANGNIINKTYYSNAPGSRALPSQTAYALAIDFGLIPKDKISRSAECLKAAIEERGGKLSVGFLGISHLAPSLSKAGLGDIAFSLLEQEENPGWLYSVKNGATTIWERWNSYIAETDTFGDVSMNSFNHYSYGAIGEWMFGEILGINTGEKEGECGYKKIILKPTFGGSLTEAKGYYESVRGRISSHWRLKGGEFEYWCSIPANTDAVLYLPSDKPEEIEFSASGGVRYIGESGERAVFALMSGTYRFRTRV